MFVVSGSEMIEPKESPVILSPKDEQRVMFEKAGQMLQKLALDAAKEKTLNIEDFELDELVVSEVDQKNEELFKSSDEISSKFSSDENSSEEEESSEGAISAVKKSKSMLESEEKTENDDDDEQKDSAIFSIKKEQREEEIIRETNFTNDDNIETNDTEEKDTENSDENDICKLNKEFDNKVSESRAYKDEAMNLLLSTAESRQNTLLEKILKLKTTAETLKEQLKKEKQLLQEEISKVVDLEITVENIPLQEQLSQPQLLLDDDNIEEKMEMFKDHKNYTNYMMNYELELKRKNYKNWLSEISSECDKQLSVIQDNLSVLKPLRETVSKWSDSTGDILEEEGITVTCEKGIEESDEDSTKGKNECEISNEAEINDASQAECSNENIHEQIELVIKNDENV